MLNNNILKLSSSAIFFFMILNIAVVYYTAQNRTCHEFAFYSIFISGILVAVCICFIIFLYFKFGNSVKEYKMLIQLLFLLIILGPIYYSLFVTLKSLALFLVSSKLIILLILLILALGFSFFILRLKLRIIYGFIEIIVGIFIAYDKLSKTNFILSLDSEFLIPLLTASIYLIVRGFDNIHQGINAENPKDPLINYFNLLLKEKK